MKLRFFILKPIQIFGRQFDKTKKVYDFHRRLVHEYVFKSSVHISLSTNHLTLTPVCPYFS